MTLYLNKLRFVAVCIVLILSMLMGGCSKGVITTPTAASLSSLVERMTNLAAFAEVPLGQSYLVSSYDRRGGNQDWAVWTKGDSNGRVTLLDVDGPGYISRMWIASFYVNRWFIYFDNEESPRLTLTNKELFGEKFPFSSPLAGKSGGGKYSLIPLPFAKHIRIEVEPTKLDPSKRNYFQINYTLLSKENSVCESWPKVLSSENSNTINRTCSVLLDKKNSLLAVGDDCLKSVTEKTVSAHSGLEFYNRRGKGRLDSFAVRIVAPVGGELMQHEILRKLRIRMYWDGAKNPSVDVPLGDFFCNPLYPRSFSSYVLGNIDGMYICRLPMAYKKGARCILLNDGNMDVRVLVGANSSDILDSRSRLRFHAKWSASTTSGRPFTMLKCSGSGHYIGCFLTSIGQDGSWNILEGDEYIIPNGDRSIGQYGTGLEDYFSGAYYYTSLFDLPYHGLIEKGAMRTDQYRFHALDAVAFEDGLEMGIEFGDQNRAQGYMSSVVYWYANKIQDVTISGYEQSLLSRPKDRFEVAGLMSQLFSLERESLWSDAADRCEFFATRYSRYPWADVLKLRALGYRKKIDGFEAVKSEYEKLANSKFAPTSRQAKDILWASERDNHALLGMHMRGKYKVWIDGIEIAEGNSKAVLDVRRLKLPPGKHTWEVDFAPTMQGSLISMCLRTKWGDITSAGEWEIMEAEPIKGRKVPESFKGGQVLPNMTVWQFEPNSYVNMQSRAQGVSIWSFWDGRPKVKRVRLRQTWTNGPSSIASAPETGKAPERTDDELKAHTIEPLAKPPKMKPKIPLTERLLQL